MFLYYRGWNGRGAVCLCNHGNVPASASSQQKTFPFVVFITFEISVSLKLKLKTKTNKMRAPKIIETCRL